MEKILKTYIDIDKPISTHKLTPRERLSVAFRVWWRESDWEKRMRDREEAKKAKQRAADIEELQNALLEQLYRRFYVEKAAFCELTVPRDKEQILKDVIEHRDFAGFKLEVLPCDPDLVYVLGMDLPIMIRASLFDAKGWRDR